MEEQRPSGIEQISQADWEQILASVKMVVETLVERMHQWETQVQQLQSKVELYISKFIATTVTRSTQWLQTKSKDKKWEETRGTARA